MRRALVVGQVALSMLLLAGAGLFARSLFNLRAVDPGLPGRAACSTFSIDPTLSGYDAARMQSLFEQTQDALTAMPGVRSASMSEIGAFTGQRVGHDRQGRRLSTEGRRGHEPARRRRRSPLLRDSRHAARDRGREFKPSDTLGAPKVAIINETMAKQFYRQHKPDRPPLGFGRGNATDIEIVGVVQRPPDRAAAIRSLPASSTSRTVRTTA